MQGHLRQVLLNKSKIPCAKPKFSRSPNPIEIEHEHINTKRSSVINAVANVFSTAATKHSLNAGVDQQPQLDSLHFSLFPLLEVLMVQVPAGHHCAVRCRAPDISLRYESFCVHTSIGWTFSLFTQHLHQL